eukprot:9502000-Pyramimonas_sp.AAC.1
METSGDAGIDSADVLYLFTRRIRGAVCTPRARTLSVPGLCIVGLGSLPAGCGLTRAPFKGRADKHDAYV